MCLSSKGILALELLASSRSAQFLRDCSEGDAHDDRAALKCRGQESTSHVGVWPEMSMLNHRFATPSADLQHSVESV